MALSRTSVFLKNSGIRYFSRSLSLNDGSLESFDMFNNRLRIKLGLSITEKCNLDCFFCHNEGMPNPRSLLTSEEDLGCFTDENRLPLEDLLQIANDFTELGGRALRITGGEPLIVPEFFDFFELLEKRDTLVYLNSNLVYADRLLEREHISKIDFINTSIHTTDPNKYVEHLGGRRDWSETLFSNVIGLQQHGYTVNVNFSLGSYNIDDFPNVLRMCRDNGIRLRVIPIVRSNVEGNPYGVDVEEDAETARTAYVSNEEIVEIVKGEGGVLMEDLSVPGGQVSMFRNVFKMMGEHDGEFCSVTNIIDLGAGRLAIEECFECEQREKCGEGIRCFRAGVDGFWRLCLLNDDMVKPIEKGKSDYKEDILDMVHEMVGGIQSDLLEGGESFISKGVPI